MARQENVREDLMAEATALVERAEIAFKPEPIVIGFRAGGAASVYFGQDDVYHFDSADRLRRAYLGGRIYKADRGRLASLDRQRTADEVQLLRHDLYDAEMAEVLDHLERMVAMLKRGFAADLVKWLRVVPEGEAVRMKIAAWVQGLPDRIEVAASARVG